MHSLFHTSAQPFSYWQGGTMDALQWLSPLIRSEEPPIVTLDAGPNVHVIVPEKHRADWRSRLHGKFGTRVILEDAQGTGAELL
jgi:mevalonate pyrophosphate decarboxylase